MRAASEAKPVLYDVPVSNNGARCRLIIYWKQLEDAFAITDPSAIGGIKSDEYLRLNPQGKMPLLVLPDELALPESEVISQYICHAYEDVGPSLIPEDPETRAVAALATRIHDVYIVPIQAWSPPPLVLPLTAPVVFAPEHRPFRCIEAPRTDGAT